MWFRCTPLVLGERVKIRKGPHRNRTGVLTFLQGYTSHILMEEEPIGTVRFIATNEALTLIRHTPESERYRDYVFEHYQEFWPERL